MVKKLKKSINKLQTSDEATKKRWLVLLTATSSLFVVLIWVVYISAGLHSVTSPVTGDTSSKPKLARIFSAGLVSVSEQSVAGLANSFVYFRNKTQAANNFIITKGNQNFIWDDLEKPPVRRLP